MPCLIINGTSTKKYKDKDWDAYRNHSIGFVFQSYNLIPHQTVLQNVEIALTLSGVSKNERRERAMKALDQVGLSDQIKKRPAEMSGGQMQRVAIARALVNNPDIILADEPTGALDSETSVQVMEILKEVSKDHLVIMVTHNPDLADKYASRIIRMLDGEIKSDSQPLSDEEIEAEKKSDEEKTGEHNKRKKLRGMSFLTSFNLSLRNLFTKKGRTILTSFAGSIGIIGIALILSISKGTTRYIDEVQEETLSSYPLTIERSTTDLSSIMETFMGGESSGYDHSDMGNVYEKSSIYEMINAYTNLESYDNDLESFKAYIEKEYENPEGKLHNALNGIQYTYDLNLEIYTKNIDGNINGTDTQNLLTDIIMEAMGVDLSAMIGLRDTMMSSYSDISSSMIQSRISIWQQLLPGLDGEIISPVIYNQYDLLAGKWPESYNEILLVIDENNELDDLSLYALGLIEEEYITTTSKAAIEGETLNFRDQSWTFDEMMNLEFHLVLSSDCYTYNSDTGCYEDIRETDSGLQYLYDNGTVLNIVGVIKPKPDTTTTMLNGCLAYTSLLTDYVIEEAKDAPAVKAQLDDPETDIFTGLKFKDAETDISDSEKIQMVSDFYAALTDDEKASEYVALMSIPSDEVIQGNIEQYMSMYSQQDIISMMADGMASEMGVDIEQISSYIEGMSDEDISNLINQMLTEQITASYAEEIMTQLSQIPDSDLADMMDGIFDTYTDNDKLNQFDEVIEFSDATYEDNLIRLGVVDINDPLTINFYASTFENKDVIKDVIEDYNAGKGDMEKIKYTDYLGIMMSSITTIINAITYVLIAFVAISLVVSSIMIGVITLISVQERTKEIGILRAIGASKKDVSSLFNAETVIIGFTSGMIGVIVTFLLCIPINYVVHTLTGINSLSAYLPLNAAVILVVISILLTLIAGVIPSGSAAKKDPVVALRTE